MTDPVRCPACGASNAPGAAWCGQCLARFDAPAPDATTQSPPTQPPTHPAATQPAGTQSPAPHPARLHAVPPPAPGPIRRAGEDLVWTCPSCESENPIERTLCSVCGTPMAALFGASRKPALRRSGPRAVLLSAILPGAGHAWAGRTADAVARIVLFVWTAGIGILLVTRGGERSGVFRAVGAVFLLTAIGVWAIALLESQRLARGEAVTIVPGRALLWATAALTLVLFLGLAAGAQTR